MKRKLFCEISPFTYTLSRYKNIFLRKLKDSISGVEFGNSICDELLPYTVWEHSSPIKRRLGNVDMQLQINKEKNLAIAVGCIDGIVIRPGEVFSFWKLVGECTRKKGYKEGLVISNDRVLSGVGGGMCQLTNLIHWMILHSELDILEHHHHDNLDLFPDCDRRVPFGTGTSIAYNYMDYRFKNNTDAVFQIKLAVENGYLYGELRCSKESSLSYEIETKNEKFIKENDNIYRTGEVIRTATRKKDGKTVLCECIRKNHAKVMYQLDI